MTGFRQEELPDYRCKEEAWARAKRRHPSWQSEGARIAQSHPQETGGPLLGMCRVPLADAGTKLGLRISAKFQTAIMTRTAVAGLIARVSDIRREYSGGTMPSSDAL
jgi:hypothetical protein